MNRDTLIMLLEKSKVKFNPQATDKELLDILNRTYKRRYAELLRQEKNEKMNS